MPNNGTKEVLDEADGSAHDQTVLELQHTRRQHLGLAAICLGFLMITLDATIVNVALRPIDADLSGSLASAQWIVNGYTLAFATLLLSAGALADRIGAKRGYMIGLAIFATGSAGCAAATSIGTLVVARVIQGSGAAWLMPCSLALIAHAFPDQSARRRALAVWGGVSGIGLGSGPVVGGLLASTIGWRSIFLVNLPVAAGALLLLRRHVAESKPHRHPLDPVGQTLAITALGLLTAGTIVAGTDGWLSATTIALLIGGLGAAGLLAVAERAATHPMIDPALFRHPTFSITIAIAFSFNLCLYGGLFCLVIDLAGPRHLATLATGVATLPMTAIIAITAFRSGRIVTQIGEWRAIRYGLAGGALGAALVAANPSTGPVLLLVVSTLPLGAVSLAMTAMTATAMSSAPIQRLGLASGVLNTARQAGGALGVGALGTLERAGGQIQLLTPFATIAAAYLLAAILAQRGQRAAQTVPERKRPSHKPTVASS